MTLSKFSLCSSSSAPATLRSSWRLYAPGKSLITCYIICWNFSVAMFTPKSKRLYPYRPSGAANTVISLDSESNSIWRKAIFRSN